MDVGTAQIIRFETFALDSAAAELRKSGEKIAIEPQVLDLLTLLLRNHDRVVTRDEIVAAVWNGRIVSDSAISSRINALRRALNEDGTEQRLVRTVHGRGFRFGVVPEFGQSAAYVEGLLKALKEDKRAIFRAASEAQKAADFVLAADGQTKEVAA